MQETFSVTSTKGSDMPGRTALLVMDFINEIVHPEGRYAGDGYLAQATRRGVLDNAARAQRLARERGIPVIHVVVGFTRNYVEWPSNSRVFAKVKEGDRIILGTWSTRIHQKVAPLDGEIVIEKNRVSPFYQTNLELILQSLGVDTLLLAGVSTEFVVLTTAIEAHDRNYKVVVLEDAVTASADDIHEAALTVIRRTADVIKVTEAFEAMEAHHA